MTSRSWPVVGIVALAAFAAGWLPFGYLLTLIAVGVGAWYLRDRIPAVLTVAAAASWVLGETAHGLLSDYSQGYQAPTAGEVLVGLALVGVLCWFPLIAMGVLVDQARRALTSSEPGANRDALFLGLVAVFTAISWWVWFGYDSDGTYTIWQGVGLGLTAIIPGAWAVWHMYSDVVALALCPLMVGAIYAISAVVTWGSQDDTGLFLIGVAMLAPGTWLAAMVVCLVVRLVRNRPGQKQSA